MDKAKHPAHVPGMTPGTADAHRARQDSGIAEAGAVYQPVNASDVPPFITSLGLSERGMSDVAFVGRSNATAAGCLDALVKMQLAGIAAPLGYVAVGTPGNDQLVPMWIAAAGPGLLRHATEAHGRLHRSGAGKPLRLLQVILPDSRNRFPWDHGYDWIDQAVETTPTHGHA